METDVLVVGAGHAGAFMAWLLAKRGLKVILIDKKKQGFSGARWINGVPGWIFDHCALDRPKAQEIYATADIFTIISPSLKASISVDINDFFDIEMGLFTDRLTASFCCYKKTELLYESELTSIDLYSANKCSARIMCKNKEITIRASLLIDASGFKSISSTMIKAFRKNQITNKHDICLASQYLFEIADQRGCMDFLDTHQAKPNDMLAFLGVQGGFSLLKTHIPHSLSTISILTGSRPVFGQKSGYQMINTFIKNHPFIGKKITGGSRAIPLKRPSTLMAAPKIALIGDAAHQVYAAHASGVVASMLGAWELSLAIDRALKHGYEIGSLNTMNDYQSQFHRKWAQLFNTSDIFRRFAANLDACEIDMLIKAQALPKSMLRSILLQKPISCPSLSEFYVTSLNKEILSKLAPVSLRFALTQFYSKYSPLKWQEKSRHRYEYGLKHIVDNY